MIAAATSLLFLRYWVRLCSFSDAAFCFSPQEHIVELRVESDIEIQVRLSAAFALETDNCMTGLVLADWMYVLAIALAVLILSLVAKTQNLFASFASNSGSASQLRTNISSYRVNVMIVTCLCIWAVDFSGDTRRQKLMALAW
ncbi:unnamed protein product [Linum trigynum]|uniref:Uncharacterized protein n=1 Tax=Linum trigynum TaxID=586398 RepID=A0AAV2EZA0_9ROSI